MARALGLVFLCFILQGALLVCANGRDSKPNIVILLADDVSCGVLSLLFVRVSPVCPLLSMACLGWFLYKVDGKVDPCCLLYTAIDYPT